VTDVPRLGATLQRLVGRYAELGEAALRDEGDDGGGRLAARLRGDLEALLLGEVAAHGCTLPAAEVRALLALDLELNADGIVAWLRARGRPPRVQAAATT
jgi:hypothetical protein